MAGKRSVAGDCANDILARFPSSPTQTLAKALYKKWPKVYDSVEHARRTLRYYQGTKGKKCRSHCVDKTHFRPPKDGDATFRKWSALVPDAEPNEWAWQELPEGPRRWLILADPHIPYHDKRALFTALAHADGNCDAVLILGDLFDSYQLSSFDRDPRKRKYSEELSSGWDFLTTLMELRPRPKSIVVKLGNHDFRVERYLCRRAPEMFDMELFSLKTFLRTGPTWRKDNPPNTKLFKGLMGGGIQCVRANDPIRHHQLALLHGHEWGNRFSSPVNPARGAFLKAHECVIQGHEHRKSDHGEATLFGTVVQCWSIGCLCDLHPEYRPIGNKWQHGFAYLNTGSDWSIENHSIIDGGVF